MSKIIMISRDVKVLDSSSAVYMRLKEYATLFDELHVVVMGRRSKLKPLNASNLYIYNSTSGFSLFSFIKTFFKSLSLARKNKSEDTWITSQDPFESGLLAFFVSKFSSAKLQLQFHTDCFNPLYFKSGVGNYIKTLIARFISPKAESIRVVSDRIKSSFLALDSRLSARVFVLPIWTDIEHIKNTDINPEHNLRTRFPEFKKIVLIVARLEREKNIELSLMAFKKALRFEPKLGLIIAGNGQKEEWLKSLVESLDIETNVRFIGWMTDVSSLYKTSDILLVTSFYEGYGLNIVEAVACGCPVVATDVGVAREVGATIVPYDAGQIALSIIDILKKNTNVGLSIKFNIAKSSYLESFKNTFN